MKHIIFVISILLVSILIFKYDFKGETFISESFNIANTTNEAELNFDFNLEKKLKNIKLEKGTFSFAYIDLINNKEYFINSDEEYYYASIFKIPVAVTVFKNIDNGNRELSDKLTYLKKDYEGGDGSLQYSDFESTYSINKLLEKLLKESDNVAMNILIREFGLDNVYQTALALDTSANFANNNKGTVNDGITMFKTIDSTNVLSKESKKNLYSFLTNTSFEDRVKPGLNPTSTYIHKIGTWPETASYHDCGIVVNATNRYYICVLTKDTTLTQAQELSTKLAKIIESLY